jgi:predicted DNA-binding protein YlxM (UPF0122 family)
MKMLRVASLCLLSCLFVWVSIAFSASYVPLRWCGKHHWCAGTGPMADPTDVKKAMDQFARDAISRWDDEVINIEKRFASVWGQGLGTEIRKNRLSDESLKEFQANSIRDMVLDYMNADSIVDSQKIFGPQARNENLEDMIEISSQYQVSRKAADQLINKNDSDFQVYENKWDTILEARSQITDMEQENINSEFLFPSTRTFAPEQIESVSKLHKQILDPLPIPMAKSTADFSKKDRSQKIRAAMNLVPQRIVFENLIDFAPSMDAARAIAVYQKMTGDTGTPEFVKNGKISRAAMMKVLSDSKFANPNWYAELGGKNKTAMLRERLIMKAFKIEQQMQQLNDLQSRVMAFAQYLSGKENKFYERSTYFLSDQVRLNKIRN